MDKPLSAVMLIQLIAQSKFKQRSLNPSVGYWLRVEDGNKRAGCNFVCKAWLSNFSYYHVVETYELCYLLQSGQYKFLYGI
jgi:hypothetical protein